jgi:hypothetical protein
MRLKRTQAVPGHDAGPGSSRYVRWYGLAAHGRPYRLRGPDHLLKRRRSALRTRGDAPAAGWRGRAVVTAGDDNG